MLDCKDAWLSLRRRLARSFLSGLGIGIGVLALVAMLSIGEGAKHKALKKIGSLGVNTIRIEYAVPDTTFGGANIRNLSQGLTRSDADRVATWLGGMGDLGYYARRNSVFVTSGLQSSSATVIGVSARWFSAERVRLDEGRPFVPDDMIQMRRVCVAGNRIGSTLRLKPGETIRVHNEPCTLIGVLRQRGRLLTEGTGLSTLDFDALVVMPYESFPFRKVMGGDRLLDGLIVRLNDDNEQRIVSTARYIDELLRVEHRGVQDYRLVVPVNLLREARETQLLFRLIMGSIAGLSLLVGGIGVMNIMLANVSEQTREIGLRMALGAPRSRIVSLYLWHSMLLCLVGGVLGLVGGILAALAVQNYAGWAVAFSGFALVLGPLFAVVTGLVFGLHPALRAASLDPAVALREA